MTDEEDLYPGNSQRKKAAAGEKKVERVTTAEPIRRKKGLGRKFKDIFFGGDPRATGAFILQGVLIPAAKDMIIDAAREGVEKLVRGDSYRRRGHPSSGPSGYVSYNRMGPSTRRPDEPRTLSRTARARHDFDEIVLQSRAEAEQVIEQLYEIISKYDTATVSDLYDLVGIRGTHVDHKWGWTDMRGAGVARVRDGYLLELPDIVPMEM